MSVRTRGRRRFATRIAIAATVAAGVSLAPQVVDATIRLVNAGATWSSTPTAYVGVPVTATVTLANEATSGDVFESAELAFNVPPSAVHVVSGSVPTGWAATVLSGTNAVVKLTIIEGSSEPAVGPGHSLTVKVTVTPPAVGTLTIVPTVNTSDDFSGTTLFTIDHSSGLSIQVIAVSLQFAQQPSATIGQSLPGIVPAYFAYFCNPVSVQTFAGAVPVAAGGIPVTLNFAGTANPGLYFGTAAVGTPGVTVNTDATGLATFGSCASGLGATVVGKGFTLTAGSAAATGPVTSSGFQVLQTCVANCTTNNSSTTTGTNGTVNANDTGNIFQIFTAFGQGVILNCDSAVTTPPVTPDPLFAITQTTTGTVSGTLTMVFPKSVVHSLANNGTPLMPVCAGASASFPRKGDPTTGVPYPGSGQFPFQGLLYDCTDPAYLSLLATNTFPEQLCVQSRTRLPGSLEQIVVFAGDLSDPSLW